MGGARGVGRGALSSNCVSGMGQSEGSRFQNQDFGQSSGEPSEEEPPGVAQGRQNERWARQGHCLLADVGMFRGGAGLGMALVRSEVAETKV